MKKQLFFNEADRLKLDDVKFTEEELKVTLDAATELGKLASAMNDAGKKNMSQTWRDEAKIAREIAETMGVEARIAARINPDIDAQTHKYISTGIEENKFGISPWEFQSLFDTIRSCNNIRLVGLHFHIGSQITNMDVFAATCARIEEIQQEFINAGFHIENIDLGGGLGVDYYNPKENFMPQFAELFECVHKHLKVREGQTIHFEPGRSVVAQCGHLISRVVYVKCGQKKKFVILDAGMNNLIRPALYQAHHEVENLTSTGMSTRYDVVGAVCESSDTFAQNALLPATQRGDLFAIHTTGAYGQVMGMRYNMRDLAEAVYSDDIK
jgi:diaminopimelate decarboxylase